MNLFQEFYMGHRYIKYVVVFWLVVFAVPDTSHSATEFHPALSLQGYTGILNTPSAAVTPEGALDIGFSNQIESKWRARTSRQDNYAFSLGLFSLLEIGGRIIEAPKVARDLSANIKLTMPFIPTTPYWPKFAVGIQDLGGGSRFLQNRYLVSSVDLWRFRLSAGYGFGPDRMKGVFGGAEFKAHDYLYLLGEYDTKETNLGIRLVSPALLQMPLHLQATVKTSLNHKAEQPEFAFGIQIPLGGAPKHVPSAPPTAADAPPTPLALPTVSGTLPETKIASPLDHTVSGALVTDARSAKVSVEEHLKIVQQQLTKTGFQNVRFGLRGTESIVVEYENPIFSHNELDAIGVVAGTVLAGLPEEIRQIELVLRKADIIIAVLEIPAEAMRSYLLQGGNEVRLQERIRVRRTLRNEQQIVYLGPVANSTPFSARLELYPGLITYVATDVGVFDFLLSLKPDLYINLWKGAVTQLRADIPVAWSQNLDDGKAYRNDRNNARIDRALLHQTISLPAAVMARVGGGMIMPDTYGTVNEVVWNPGAGAHSFQVFQELAQKSKGGVTIDYSAYTAGYRYYCALLDTSVRIDGGRFWTKDTGITMELKRFFGDVETTIFYKNSQLPDHGGNVQAGGITFALPLTLRKEFTRPPLQLTGSNEWSYSQQSLIVTPGESNYVSVSTGIRPQLSYNLMRTFANRDRLSTAYIKSNLARMREAWLKYGIAETEK
jgi:hypothetical protein